MEEFEHGLTVARVASIDPPGIARHRQAEETGDRSNAKSPDGAFLPNDKWQSNLRATGLGQKCWRPEASDFRRSCVAPKLVSLDLHSSPQCDHKPHHKAQAGRVLVFFIFECVGDGTIDDAWGHECRCEGGVDKR